MVQGPRGVVDNAAAEPGDVTGWARVMPESLRFASFSSPRTGQTISGLCCELERTDQSLTREVWINNRNGWRRAEGWMRKAFTDRVDQEHADGKVDSMPLEEDAVGQL